MKMPKKLHKYQNNGHTHSEFQHLFSIAGVFKIKNGKYANNKITLKMY